MSFNMCGLHPLHKFKEISTFQTFGKESPFNVGDLSSIPGSGRSSGEGNGNPLQYLAWRIHWTEEPGRIQSWDHKESDTTEQLAL